MKKSIFVLGSVFACAAVVGCNPTNKVTSIKITTVSYALTDKTYDVDVVVEGKGSFSKDVTFKSSDPHVYITSDHKFKYMSNMLRDPVEVTITATSKQTPSVKADFKITFLANYIKDSTFLSYANLGDIYRLNVIKKAQEETAGTKEVTVKTEHDSEDYLYGFQPGGDRKVKVDTTEYKITTEEAESPTAAGATLTN